MASIEHHFSSLSLEDDDEIEFCVDNDPIVVTPQVEEQSESLDVAPATTIQPRAKSFGKAIAPSLSRQFSRVEEKTRFSMEAKPRDKRKRFDAEYGLDGVDERVDVVATEFSIRPKIRTQGSKEHILSPLLRNEPLECSYARMRAYEQCRDAIHKKVMQANETALEDSRKHILDFLAECADPSRVLLPVLQFVSYQTADSSALLKNLLQSAGVLIISAGLETDSCSDFHALSSQIWKDFSRQLGSMCPEADIKRYGPACIELWLSNPDTVSFLSCLLKDAKNTYLQSLICAGAKFAPIVVFLSNTDQCSSRQCLEQTVLSFAALSLQRHVPIALILGVIAPQEPLELVGAVANELCMSSCVILGDPWMEINCLMDALILQPLEGTRFSFGPEVLLLALKQFTDATLSIQAFLNVLETAALLHFTEAPLSFLCAVPDFKTDSTSLENAVSEFMLPVYKTASAKQEAMLLLSNDGSTLDPSSIEPLCISKSMVKIQQLFTVWRTILRCLLRYPCSKDLAKIPTAEIISRILQGQESDLGRYDPVKCLITAFSENMAADDRHQAFTAWLAELKTEPAVANFCSTINTLMNSDLHSGCCIEFVTQSLFSPLKKLSHDIYEQTIIQAVCFDDIAMLLSTLGLSCNHAIEKSLKRKKRLNNRLLEAEQIDALVLWHELQDSQEHQISHDKLRSIFMSASGASDDGTALAEARFENAVASLDRLGVTITSGDSKHGRASLLSTPSSLQAKHVKRKHD